MRYLLYWALLSVTTELSKRKDAGAGAEIEQVLCVLYLLYLALLSVTMEPSKRKRTRRLRSSRSLPWFPCFTELYRLRFT